MAKWSLRFTSCPPVGTWICWKIIYHICLYSLKQQTQIPDYAELVVKFLDALIDTYLPGIEEEGGEESLRTPTSPYPPTVQSQLSITANLNLSNSMTSLATSQHSPGQCSHLHHTHKHDHTHTLLVKCI